MQPSRKTILAIAFAIIGILVIIAVVYSWIKFPEWRTAPGGVIGLIIAAIIGVVGTLAKGVVGFANDILKLVESLWQRRKTPPKFKTAFSDHFYRSYCSAPGTPESTRDEFTNIYGLTWTGSIKNTTRRGCIPKTA